MLSLDKILTKQMFTFECYVIGARGVFNDSTQKPCEYQCTELYQDASNTNTISFNQIIKFSLATKKVDAKTRLLILVIVGEHSQHADGDGVQQEEDEYGKLQLYPPQP